MTVGVDESYVVEQQGESLRVGQQAESEVRWFDAAVPLSELSEEARQAWDSRDAGSRALLVAVDGVATAVRNRGG